VKFNLRSGLFARHVVSNGTSVNVHVNVGMVEYVLGLVCLYTF
jgi:hypothetical protein